MSKITSIATAVPPYKQSQMQIFEKVCAIQAATEEEARVLNFMYRSSGIETRYAAVPDFNIENKECHILYNEEGLWQTKGLEERLQVYHGAALQLSLEVIQKCLSPKWSPADVTHLITVSCTGMQAPGLDLAIIKELNLNKNIYRTSVNFMGCYAAIHGLKQAHYIAEKEPNAKVLVVCVELCTLHFQKDKSIDNVISTVIFGDGAAAVLVENSNSPSTGWQLENFYSEIHFEGMNDMAWKISADGFLMTLTNKVPEILEKKCQSIIANALQHYGIAPADVDRWCVHPGGKRILEAVERGTFITRSQLQESYDVLRAYGNMSSPTILFVLEKILKESVSSATNKNIVGMAFGPGLTLETFHLSYA